MAFEIIQSIKAESDLDNILVYITFQLNNPTAASNLLDKYESRLTNLRKSPHFYRLSNIERLSHSGYHQFTFGNCIAFYIINDEAKTVSIVRIFYKKQDYESIL